MDSVIRQQAERCLTCARPSCKSACPLGNDGSQIIGLVKRDEYARAVAAIGHPFGEICGYVCPHEQTCQGGCVLNKRKQPVLVGTIERELFAEYPYVIERKGSALKGQRYAIVGGGISGLTFATKVYEQGADVTVYERDELLSTVKLIPNFRLPVTAVLRAEQCFTDKFEVVREQIDGPRLKLLQDRYNGVYVATGLATDYGLGVEEQALATNYRDCLKGDYASGRVVIVGGGNSAMDCARLVNKQGSKAIVSYRRTEADMPAFAREIAEAVDEGVEFVFNAAPVLLTKTGDGLRLTLAKTVSEGRGKLTVTKDTFDVDCDSVIAAVGSKFDGSLLSDDANYERYLQYGNVYLGGDAKGGKLVVDAVRDGLCAAKQIMENRGKDVYR